ncbi:uncharacterized protein LOC108142237 [Drosophila elegans]|uniref:uncharacterized protein LOC108142237 n=1 Tax=Drosophila elegans TaxID=30023 RepID=UPI0007E7861B|nr:uncharacterized protein LOC108142237 [Drosophila elegans]
MLAANGLNFAVFSIFFLLLVCNIGTNYGEEITKDVGSFEPSKLTFWERIVSGVKNYPWKTDKIEKESKETAERRAVFWQRLTMATVL